MSESSDYYRHHVLDDAPLFHLPWWLDAVCDNNWDVAIFKREDQLVAYYIYATHRNRFGFHLIMPELTQFLGPNYRLNATNIREINNEEMEILETLLSQLPKSASFESRWHFTFQNWLPFYWQGFRQCTRYTYVLEDISNPDSLRQNFSEKIQREISKAEKKFMLEESNDVIKFYQLLEKNFAGKKMKMPFQKSLVNKIFSAAQLNHAGKIFLAVDDLKKVAAGIFVVWDATTAYYIIGGKDDDFGNSGAMSLLFWSAFNELKDRVKSFDFEGSMLRGVENYFRSFGAEQKGFFEITKINSPILKIRATVKSLLRK
ncbi:MAG: GNAT family N-acetyltransferase [Chitinophagales bacterium]